MTAGAYLKIIVVGVSALVAIAAIAVPARSLPAPVIQMGQQAAPTSVDDISHAPHDVSPRSFLMR